MNFHNNNTTKLIIFILGIMIILIAPFLLDLKSIEMWKIIFVDLVILTIYIMFFYPAITLLQDKNKTGAMFVAGGVYYKGVYAYALISAFIIYAIFGMGLKRSIATLLQLIAIFVFLIYIYLANVSANHIEKTKSYEKNKTMIKRDLKSKMQNLQVDVEDISNSEVKELIKEINEDLCYLSPTDNTDGLQLEESILDLIENISDRSTLNDEQYLDYLKEIKRLITKRKNIM